jgi:uncharacterized membrane protein
VRVLRDAKRGGEGFVVPIGPILLTILVVMILFGLAERVLERMRISQRTALLLTAGMLLGSLVRIPLGPNLSINLGGGLIPVSVCLWLISTADETVERVRAVASAVLAAAAVGAVARWFPAGEPTELNLFYLDASYLYALSAAAVAYLSGRSRRAAFCGGVLGVLLGDLAHTRFLADGAATYIGGGGLLDTAVVAGVLAVFLVELVGETREALAHRSKGSAGDG